MRFAWDSSNRRHRARHKVTPEEFEEAIKGEKVIYDVEDVEGEERWRAVGTTKGRRVLALLFTYRQGRIRPITAWDVDSETAGDYFRIVGKSGDD